MKSAHTNTECSLCRIKPSTTIHRTKYKYSKCCGALVCEQCFETLFKLAKQTCICIYCKGVITITDFYQSSFQDNYLRMFKNSTKRVVDVLNKTEQDFSIKDNFVLYSHAREFITQMHQHSNRNEGANKEQIEKLLFNYSIEHSEEIKFRRISEIDMEKKNTSKENKKIKESDILLEQAKRQRTSCQIMLKGLKASVLKKIDGQEVVQNKDIIAVEKVRIETKLSEREGLKRLFLIDLFDFQKYDLNT